MVCRRCLKSTEKEHNLWQEEDAKKRSIVLKQKKKTDQKPEMAFVDIEKHTVTGSPEVVSRVFKKIDQIVQELACENNIVQTIKEDVRMEYVMDKPLLDVIAKELCCENLSDLRYMKSFSRMRAARFIEEMIPAADASLNEWNDALSYLASAPAEGTQDEARQRLLEYLQQGSNGN